MSVARFSLFVAIGLVPLFAMNAAATDQIICVSKTFKVAFAVGSDGYASNVELSDLSGKNFAEVLEITDMSKKRRYVSIADKRVDVKAFIGMKNANALVINIRSGKGYIKLDSLKEDMACDWGI